MASLQNSNSGSQIPAEVLIPRIKQIHGAISKLDSLRPSKQVNSLFSHLVKLCILPSSINITSLPKEAQEMRKSLIDLCGRAEGLLELDFATFLIKSPQPFNHLNLFPYYGNYVKLANLEYRILGEISIIQPKKVAFIGSGAMPLTSIIMATHHLKLAQFDNFDIDESANEFARKIVGSNSDLQKRMKFETYDVMEVKEKLGEYDCIFLAALVGMTKEEKVKIIRHIRKYMKEGGILLVRSANGARAFLYPVVDYKDLVGFEFLSIFHPTNDVINSVLSIRRSFSIVKSLYAQMDQALRNKMAAKQIMQAEAWKKRKILIEDFSESQGVHYQTKSPYGLASKHHVMVNPPNIYPIVRVLSYGSGSSQRTTSDLPPTTSSIGGTHEGYNRAPVEPVLKFDKYFTDLFSVDFSLHATNINDMLIPNAMLSRNLDDLIKVGDHSFLQRSMQYDLSRALQNRYIMESCIREAKSNKLFDVEMVKNAVEKQLKDHFMAERRSLVERNEIAKATIKSLKEEITRLRAQIAELTAQTESSEASVQLLEDEVTSPKGQNNELYSLAPQLSAQLKRKDHEMVEHLEKFRDQMLKALVGSYPDIDFSSFNDFTMSHNEDTDNNPPSDPLTSPISGLPIVPTPRLSTYTSGKQFTLHDPEIAEGRDFALKS